MCLDSKNKRNLCKEFKIKQDFGNGKDIDYQRYWDEIIMRIQHGNWWDVACPQNSDDKEKSVWKYRAAFIDSLFYEHSNIVDDDFC